MTNALQTQFDAPTPPTPPHATTTTTSTTSSTGAAARRTFDDLLGAASEPDAKEAPSGRTASPRSSGTRALTPLVDEEHPRDDEPSVGALAPGLLATPPPPTPPIASSERLAVASTTGDALPGGPPSLGAVTIGGATKAEPPSRSSSNAFATTELVSSGFASTGGASKAVGEGGPRGSAQRDGAPSERADEPLGAASAAPPFLAPTRPASDSVDLTPTTTRGGGASAAANDPPSLLAHAATRAVGGSPGAPRDDRDRRGELDGPTTTSTENPAAPIPAAIRQGVQALLRLSRDIGATLDLAIADGAHGQPTPSTSTEAPHVDPSRWLGDQLRRSDLLATPLSRTDTGTPRQADPDAIGRTAASPTHASASTRPSGPIAESAARAGAPAEHAGRGGTSDPRHATPTREPNAALEGTRPTDAASVAGRDPRGATKDRAVATTSDSGGVAPPDETQGAARATVRTSSPDRRAPSAAPDAVESVRTDGSTSSGAPTAPEPVSRKRGETHETAATPQDASRPDPLAMSTPSSPRAPFEARPRSSGDAAQPHASTLLRAQRQDHAEVAVSRMTLRSGMRADAVLPELGRVSVESRARDGAIDLRVTADRSETAALLASSRGEMRSDLDRSHVPVSDISVSVGGSGVGAQGSGARQDGREHAPAPRSTPRSEAAPGEAPTSTTAQAARSRRVRIVL